MGNTPSVAHRHYLIVTDEDYAKALIRGGQTAYKLGTQPPASCSDPPSRPRTESHDNSATPLLLSDNASFAEFAEVLENAQVAEEELELTILFRGKRTRGLEFLYAYQHLSKVLHRLEVYSRSEV